MHNTRNSTQRSLTYSVALLAITGFHLLTMVGCENGPIIASETQARASQEPAAEQNDNEPAQKPKSPVPEVDQREVGPPDDGSTTQENENSVDDELSSPEEHIPTIAELEAIQKKIEEEFHLQTIEPPPTWKRMGESHLWLDEENGQAIARGMICLNRGGLEMFACNQNTKEHESIISVHSKSSFIHALFLVLKAEPGNPVQWGEEYVPAKGPVIDIEIWWKDGEKIIKRKAQELVRNFETKKEMDQDWVFGGSITVIDEKTGESTYYGDGGELICLSNFATATMDLPIKSSADAEMGLMFEANTEKIPPINTKGYLVMTPRKGTPDGAEPETAKTGTEPEEENKLPNSTKSSEADANESDKN